MIKILSALIFTLFAASAFAASGDIIKKLGDVKTLTADFSQINTYEGVQDNYTGNIKIIMKDKAIFEYTEPYVGWYIFMKGAMETYDSVTNQLVKYSKGSLDGNIFFEVLTDFSAIESNFEVKSLSDKTLALTPKKDIGVKYLVVEVDDEGKIASMKMEEVLGSATELRFKNVKTDIKIPASAFVKKLPDGVNVIEQ